MTDLSLVTDRLLAQNAHLKALVKALERIADALEQEYPPTKRRIPE